MSFDICLELVDTIRYSREQNAARTSDTDEGKSGILERNALVWYTRGSVLEAFNVNSSFKVFSQNFHSCTSKSKPCTIECIEELDAHDCNLLAVSLRLGIEQTQIVILSVRGCREVGRIDVQEDVKIMRFIAPSSCSIGLLSEFSGCLALGTVDGKIIMVDLCLKLVKNGNTGSEIAMNDEAKRQCHIEFNRCEPKQMAQHHEKVRDRGMYFALQFSHDVEASVESILDIAPLKATCAGFADGTILILDLVDQSIMHRIFPPTEDCSVIAMNFVEPSDDPKACLYLWGFYAHPEGAFAFLYMVMCQEKYIQQGAAVYDQFLSCSSRLSLSSYDPGSVPLHVQSVTKKVTQEDEPITLSVLSWLGSDRTTTLMVFDLNQWYKAEMPYECDWQDELTHMVVFKLQEPSFHARLNERSLVLFSSIQRPEEHFYPNSLAFDIMNFNGLNRTMYRWVGLQNKLLQYLDQDGANSIIEPSKLYQILYRAALLPQFHEHLPPDDSVQIQREFILSLGLEYNCRMFLQSCVDLWSDGSHIGADPERGVSLSTLTDWIRNRSAGLKTVCNGMFALLLDSGGRRVDERTQDDLSRCTRQMKQLAGLYRTILADCSELIPENVMVGLLKESASISAAAEYQDVLQWLLHIGILPEVHESSLNSSEEDQDSVQSGDDALLVPYPYSRLSEFYRTQRNALYEDYVSVSSDVPSSAELLFIDTFIEREFNKESIQKVWLENAQGADSEPLYPPKSLQKALRVLLIPEKTMERKLVLLLYLFMDIVAVLGDGRYRNVLQQLEKFPRMFNLRTGVMRRVQAFWHLDHGNVVNMVEEFLSPLSSTIDFPQWHKELAVSVLLHLDAAHLALKVLRAQGCPVSPRLELCTLVQNNLISEAFSLQRRTPHPDGRQLIWFLEAILKVGKPETLLEFVLTEEEKLVVQRFLRDCPLPLSDSLMLGHLLQNLEFVEAVHLVDRLARNRNIAMETQRDILSLYHKALDPTSQRLAYLTYSEPKELEPSINVRKEGRGSPSSPNVKSNVDSLSSSLIRNRADFRVRILHHSIVAIKEAAAVTGLQHERPFLEKPGLGVFQCRPMVRSCNVSYPVRLDPSMNKRRWRECDVSFEVARMTHYEDQRQQAGTPLLDEDDAYGNPRKKRFLGSNMPHGRSTGFGGKYPSFDTPVPVIPEFRVMKPKFNFTAASSDTLAIDKECRLVTPTTHSPSIFLTTPPMSKKQAQPNQEGHGDSPKSEGNDSFTPPSILKPSQSGQSIATAQGDRLVQVESEEKVLRFDLPTRATLDSSCLAEKGTTLAASHENKPDQNTRNSLEQCDLDLSAISNDDFYSPEVTMENSSFQQLFGSAGPARRRPLHHSRSVTPTGSSGGGENIAIIIEDHVDEECSIVADDHKSEGTQDSTAMEVDDVNEISEGNVVLLDDYNKLQELATIEEEPENERVRNEADEDVGLGEVTCNIGDGQEPVADWNILASEMAEQGYENAESVRHDELWDNVLNRRAENREHVEYDEELIEDIDLEQEENENVNEDWDAYGDEVEIILDEEEQEEAVEDSNPYEEEEHYEEEGGAELQNGELDNSAEENGCSNDSSSIMEVIDLSDEGTSFSGSSSSSSPSPDDDDSGQGVVLPNEVVANGATYQQAENNAYASGSSPLQLLYDDEYSESVPGALLDQLPEEEQQEEGHQAQEQKQDEQEVRLQEQEGEEAQEEKQHEEEETLVSSPADAMDCIQVPATSSSTHRTEDPGVIDSSDESSEVEDLSVQQQDTPEIADSSVEFAGIAAPRNRSVAGEQWEDGVASTSGQEEVIRVGALVQGTTTPGASAVAGTAVSSPTQAQSQPPTQQAFGQPKNAHELEVPAMNLSVKPDEAHGSSRKNSKGEENGLTAEARALNLSAGQQELGEQANPGSDDVSSNNENDDAEGEHSQIAHDNEHHSSDEAIIEQRTHFEEAESKEAGENEPHSSDEGTVTAILEPVLAETMEASLETSEDEPNSTKEKNRGNNPMAIEEEKTSEAKHENETMEVEQQDSEGIQATIAGPSLIREQCVELPERRREALQNVEASVVPMKDEEPSNTNETALQEDEPQGEGLKTDERESDQQVERSQHRFLQKEGETPSSSRRANVKTRHMAAMEKSNSNVAPAIGTIGTPTRRRSVRASSVLPEASNLLTPTLSRSRLYASMDNVPGTSLDATLPQTPRRSTRASSLAKELFACSTPQKRHRRESQSSIENADQRGSVPNSPTESAMEPPEPSEKSFASSTASSTRRSTRRRKPKAQEDAQSSELQRSAGGAPLLSDYSSNRRLTRHQLAVMEKSMEMVASSSSASRMPAMERASKADVSADAGGDSESESIVSNVSNQSSLRSTLSHTTRASTRRSSVEARSNRGGSKRGSTTTASQRQHTGASEIDSDSDLSMVSGSRRRSHELEPIAEEAETNTGSTRKRRGRAPKPKTDK